MEICFVSLSAYGYFNPEMYSKAAGGGAQRQLYLIAQELVDTHDIHFVVGDYGQDALEVRDGVTLHKSFQPVGSTVKKPLEMVKLFNAMRRARADVYVSRYGARTSVVTYLCAKALGKKWVFNVANDKFVEGLDYLSLPLRALYIYVLKNADGIISQTRYQQRCLEDSFGVESVVTPNAYTTIDKRPEYNHRNYFLWVGRLDPEQKQPDLFIELAEQVPGAEFLLIGARDSEQYRKELKQRISAKGNIRCKFDVPPDEIHQYYQRAIALVSTSAYEGFPNTFLEAWRVGTPVLSLDVDPERFLEQDRTTEFQAGDLDTLSELVREFDSNEEYWEQVSRTVKHRFEQQYSIEEVADKYIREIEAAVRS